MVSIPVMLEPIWSAIFSGDWASIGIWRAGQNGVPILAKRRRS